MRLNFVILSLLSLLLLLSLVFPTVQSGWLDDDDSGGDSHDHNHDDSDSEEDFSTVTYGSAIRLVHKSSGFKLHSHNIKWGSGSGQQSVTGFPDDGDSNSIWLIRSAFSSSPNPTAAASGTPVRCDDIIRLYHATTKKFLHSHLHQSPLSHRQEISGYGEGGKDSDTGDNWRVECVNGGGKGRMWLRGDVEGGKISLVHVDTGKRLYTRRADGFDQNNCRGCPIVGQLEVSAHGVSLSDVNGHWYTGDGYYFPIVRQEGNKAETA